MAIDRRFKCPDCGQMVLNLWNHGCPGAKPKPPPNKLEEFQSKGRSQRQVASQPVIHDIPKPAKVQPSSVSGQALRRKEKPSTERTRKWREANRERDREYRRKYMRDWRSRP